MNELFADVVGHLVAENKEEACEAIDALRESTENGGPLPTFLEPDQLLALLALLRERVS